MHSVVFPSTCKYGQSKTSEQQITSLLNNFILHPKKGVLDGDISVRVNFDLL